MVSTVLSGRSATVGFPATAWLANFRRRFATVSTEQAGRIHALFLIPELVPVMVAAGFVQGQQMAKSLGRPKLTRTLEAALLLPTG